MKKYREHLKGGYIKIDTSERVIIDDSPELWTEQVIPYTKDYHFKFVEDVHKVLTNQKKY